MLCGVCVEHNQQRRGVRSARAVLMIICISNHLRRRRRRRLRSQHTARELRSIMCECDANGDDDAVDDDAPTLLYRINTSSFVNYHNLGTIRRREALSVCVAGTEKSARKTPFSHTLSGDKRRRGEQRLIPIFMLVRVVRVVVV